MNKIFFTFTMTMTLMITSVASVYSATPQWRDGTSWEMAVWQPFFTMNRFTEITSKKIKGKKSIHNPTIITSKENPDVWELEIKLMVPQKINSTILKCMIQKDTFNVVKFTQYGFDEEGAMYEQDTVFKPGLPFVRSVIGMSFVVPDVNAVESKRYVNSSKLIIQTIEKTDNVTKYTISLRYPDYPDWVVSTHEVFWRDGDPWWFQCQKLDIEGNVLSIVECSF